MKPILKGKKKIKEGVEKKEKIQKKVKRGAMKQKTMKIK